MMMMMMRDQSSMSLGLNREFGNGRTPACNVPIVRPFDPFRTLLFAVLQLFQLQGGSSLQFTMSLLRLRTSGVKENRDQMRQGKQDKSRRRATRTLYRFSVIGGYFNFLHFSSFIELCLMIYKHEILVCKIFE